LEILLNDGRIMFCNIHNKLPFMQPKSGKDDDVMSYFRVIKWRKIKQTCAWNEKKCMELVVIKQRMRVCRKAVRSYNDNIKKDLKINRMTLMTVVL